MKCVIFTHFSTLIHPLPCQHLVFNFYAVKCPLHVHTCTCRCVQSMKEEEALPYIASLRDKYLQFPMHLCMYIAWSCVFWYQFSGGWVKLLSVPTCTNLISSYFWNQIVWMAIIFFKYNLKVSWNCFRWFLEQWIKLLVFMYTIVLVKWIDSSNIWYVTLWYFKFRLRCLHFSFTSFK